MRTIFLNGNEFEWNYIGKLKEEAKKYGITIGSNVSIDSNVSIGADVIISSDVSIGSNVIISSNVNIWSNVSIGSDIRIGSGVKIWSGTRIPVGIKGKVYKVQRLSGLYRYEQDIIYTDKDIYIKMGCLTFTVDKWKGNFWNNDNEFLNDGDEGSVDRLEAFNICMRILKLDEIKG